MASYLGDYKGAAKDREFKFRRGVQSVLDQTSQDWELLIVADGCDKTMAMQAQFSDARIKFQRIAKQPLWSPNVRNMGILGASGDWVVYLDTDDVFGPEHLALLAPPQDMVWGYFNMLELIGQRWGEVACNPAVRFRCGTGNLMHRPGIFWPDSADDYMHDWTFIRGLRALGEGVRLPTPQYYLMHIPNRYDK